MPHRSDHSGSRSSPSFSIKSSRCKPRFHKVVFSEPPYALTFLAFNSISESLKEKILGHIMAAKSPLHLCEKWTVRRGSVVPAGFVCRQAGDDYTNGLPALA